MGRLGCGLQVVAVISVAGNNPRSSNAVSAVNATRRQPTWSADPGQLTRTSGRTPVNGRSHRVQSSLVESRGGLHFRQTQRGSAILYLLGTAFAERKVYLGG